GLVAVEIERVERLPREVAKRALWAGLLVLAPRVAAVEEAERIDDLLGPVHRRPAGGLAHPHVPGRAVADRGRALVGDDVVVPHPGEIVVRLVVLAHMVEAVVVVLALAMPALRRAVAAGLRTTGPLAARRFLGR